MSAESALVELVTYRSAALLRTAFLLTGNRAEAEDLLQESLFRVFKHRHRIRDPGALEAFVRTTMVRTNIDTHRRRSSRELPLSVVPEAPHSREQSHEPQWHDAAWPAIIRLPTRQRAVVVLTYYEDLPEREVAEALGCSVGTVKSHRARALATLRAELALLGPVSGGGDR